MTTTRILVEPTGAAVPVGPVRVRRRRQDAVTRAPGGVVDPALTPAVVDGPADVIRILPPIWHEVHPARAVADEAFEGMRETVPVADPSDDEVAP